MVDALDITGGAKSLTGLVPGAKGTILGGGVEVLHGTLAGDREKEDLRKTGIDLERAQTYSVAARKKLERLDGLATGNLIKFGIYALGSLIGGMTAMTFLGVVASALPLGGLIVGGLGALGGGWLAGRMYEGACEKCEQDVVTRAAEDYRTHKSREPLDRVHAFATLMASLPPKVQAYYERRLEDKIGTKDFAQAVHMGKDGERALRMMMNDSRLEELLRSYVHIPPNPNNTEQHVADQYAELVENNVLDPRDIVLHPEKIRAAASRYYMENAVRNQAASMAQGNDAVLPQRQLPVAAERGRQSLVPNP